MFCCQQVHFVVIIKEGIDFLTMKYVLTFLLRQHGINFFFKEI